MRICSPTLHRLPDVFLQVVGFSPRATAGVLLVIVSLMIVSPLKAQTIRGGWGPFDANLDLGLKFEVEYTDNANNSETDLQSETILSVGPYIGGTLGLDLPVRFSGGQRFSVTTSLSYDAEYSLTNGTWDETISSPVNVAVVMPLWVYGWDVILADNFTFSNEPLESSFSFSEGSLEQYDNIASVTIGRRFGRYGVNLIGSRSDTWVPDAPTIEETEYRVSLIPEYYFRSNMSVFLDWTATWVYPDDPSRRDISNHQIGLGVAGQITQTITGTISAGWSFNELHGKVLYTNAGPVVLPSESLDAPYINLNLNYAQNLRPNTSHSLSLYHSPNITGAVENSDLQRTTAATYNISHRLSRHLVLSPILSWQFVESIRGTPPLERVHIVQLGLDFRRSFGKHLTGSLRYEFQTRSSNLDGNSYDVNTVTLTMLYIF